MTRPPRRRLALALLAVLLAAGSLPTTGQVPDVADLRAGGLRLAGPPPAWLDGTAVGTRVEVTVANHGAAPASYTVSYYWNSVGDYLGGSQPSSTDAGRLDPGASRVHGMDWVPQEAQEGDGTILAVVEPTNDGTPGDNTARLPLHVPAHRLALSFLPDETSIRLGETRFLRFRATNLGTAAEALDLTVSPQGASPLRASMDPAHLVIRPGRTAESILYVERPPGADDAPDTRFTVRLRNASAPAWAPSATSPPFNASEAAVPPGHLGTALQSPAAPGALPPGARFDLAFRLTNTGSASNSLRLAATGPHGWGLAVDTPRVALDATGSAVVRLSGAVPLDAPAGSLHDLALAATSERGTAGNAAGGVALRVTGPVVLPPRLVLPEFAYQGEPVNVTIEVRNAGTAEAPAGNVTLAADRLVPGLPATLPVPALAPGTTARIPFAFTPVRSDPVVRLGAFAVADRDGDRAADADEGIYVAFRPDAPSSGFVHPEGGGRVGLSDVRVNATGGAPGSRVPAGSPQLSEGFYVRLAPPRCLDDDRDGRCGPAERLYLDAGAPPGVASPGDVRLEPFGDRAAGSRVLALDPETGLALLPAAANESLAFADANGNGLFDPSEAPFLDLGLDGVAGPGDLRLTPLADSRGAVLRPFGSRIAAGDRDNGSLVLPIATRHVDGILGTLQLGALWASHDGALVASEPSPLFVRTAAVNVTAPAGFEASPGESLDLGVPPQAFQVRNAGNAPERIALRATSGTGRIALAGPGELLLAPGESRIVAVNATLPSTLADGSVELRLEAWLADHDSTRVQGVTVVTLRDLTPPKVAFVDPPSLWSVARRVPVLVAASDDVGIRHVNVTATPADAGRPAVSAALQAGPDGRWRGHLALPAGNHTLVAEATDSAGRRTQTAPAALRVAAVLPPRLLRLVPEDGATVPRDQDLMALFDDPAGLAGATVRVDGGTPFEVEPEEGNRTVRADLGNLSAGPHRIDLSVASRAGSFWNATLQVVAHGQTTVAASDGRESPFLGASWAALALALLGMRRRRTP
jgi:hypothetical protein